MTPKEYVLKYVPDAAIVYPFSDNNTSVVNSKSTGRYYGHESNPNKAWEVAAKKIKAERIKANDGWISVNDELPHDDRNVRVRVDGRVIELPCWWIENKSQWFKLGFILPIQNVTHWKPFETDTLID